MSRLLDSIDTPRDLRKLEVGAPTWGKQFPLGSVCCRLEVKGAGRQAVTIARRASSLGSLCRLYAGFSNSISPAYATPRNSSGPLLRSPFVLDLFFLAVSIGFFAAALAYVSACERL